MAVFLWRVNPRTSRVGLTFLLSDTRTGAASDDVYTTEYFGLFSRGQIQTGQGSVTSDLSASASTPAASITAGQGSFTTDGTANLDTDGVVDSGQGAITSDGAGLVPIDGVGETGQSFTTYIVADISPFQSIGARGWWDAADYTTQPGQGFFGISPRSTDNLIARLANGIVTPDELFTLHPYNVYRDGMGAPAITYANQTAYPTAISPGFVGTPSIRNQYEYVYPSGWQSDSLGTAVIYNSDQYIIHSGSSYATFGTTDVQLGTFPQYVTAVGWESHTWGTAYVYNKNYYVTQGVTPVQVKFGTTHVENSARTVRPSGLSAIAFGTHTVQNYTRYINCSGWKSDTFGTVDTVGPRYLRPSGIAATLFGPFMDVSYKNRTLAPTGIAPYFFYLSAPNIYLNTRYLYLDGIEPPEIFGGVTATPPFDIIDCTDHSIDESAVGDVDTYHASVYPARYIRLNANGISATTFGTPTIIPTKLYPLGKTHTTYGRPEVSNYTRYLLPTSLGVMVRFGTQWASLYTRYLLPNGWDKSIVWDFYGPISLDGTKPGVYPVGATVIAPEGFEGSGNTYDNCGFPRMPSVPRPSVHR